jgi:hypothetical protein
MVPMNRPNKDGKPSAEGEEGRSMIKENASQSRTSSTQSETSVRSQRHRLHWSYLQRQPWFELPYAASVLHATV